MKQLVKYDFRYQFQPGDVYNMGKTGVTTVQTPQKILCDTRRQSVGGVASAERGHLVTLACTINAAGNTVPPLLIFSRVKYHRKFINGAPVGLVEAGIKVAG